MRMKAKNGGFSLLEMVIVVSIIMVISAIAIPKIMESIYDVRLRSAGTSVAGLMQQARQMAIKDNTYYPIKTKQQGGTWLMFIDTTSPTASPSRITNTAYDNSFPTVQLGGGVLRTTTNPDTGGTSTPWAFTPLSTAANPIWGPMGLPCVMSSAVCVGSSSGGSGTIIAGYMVILTDNRRFGTPGYLAITSSPGGRVRVWRWSGSAWQ